MRFIIRQKKIEIEVLPLGLTFLFNIYYSYILNFLLYFNVCQHPTYYTRNLK